MAGSDYYVDRDMPRGTDESAGVIQPRWGDRSVLSTAAGVKADVGTPMPQYLVMAPKWDIISTVAEGTPAMRAAGRRYLPMHQYEGDEAYKERLSRAVLKNYTLRTLENLTSKAFRDAPVFGDDVPSQIKDLAEDIDTEGNNHVVFARSWFRKAIERGFAFCLVDHTRSEPIVGRERTLADDRLEGVRPFWRLIDPANVLFIREERVAGKTRVVEARIREWDTVPVGWGVKTVERIRVLTPGKFDLYENRAVRRNNVRSKPKWELVDSGPMDLDYVPLVPFYTAKDGLFEGKPPLEDLAYLNVEHWQSSSDQRAILTVSRFPILAVSGATNNDPNGDTIAIGPKKWLSVADAAGRIYYVEHEGAAIEAGRKDLEDIEDQMASYGSEFLRKRPGASSATGRALDSAEAIAPLVAWGMDFKDALELALQYTSDWLKLDTGGTVNYQIKPDVSVGESKELDTLDSARERRDISRKTYLGELVRRDILSPEFDEAKDWTELEDEPQPETEGFSATINSSGRRSAPKPPGGGGVPEKRGPERTSGEPPLSQ